MCSTPALEGTVLKLHMLHDVVKVCVCMYTHLVEAITVVRTIELCECRVHVHENSIPDDITLLL